MLRIGLDGGNNTIIAAIEGLQKALIIPTVYSPFKDYSNGLENEAKKLEDSIDVEITLNFDNSKAKKELGRYNVGNLARAIEGTNASVREIGKQKAGDEGLLICMLATLALGVIKSQNKEEGLLSEEIKLVTGLPILQYQDEFNRGILEKTLKGKHKVKFNGKYDIEVELNISDVDVDAEGAGAINEAIFNAEGDFIYPDAELIDRIVLGVEIGEFTTELIALAFNEDEESGEVYSEYYSRLCTGIELGIANAKQTIIDNLRDRHNTIIDRYDIDRAVRRKLRKGEIDLENGETFNILQDYENNLKETASKITQIISNKVKNAGAKGKIKEAILLGGGVCTLDNKMGNFMREYWKETIGSSNKIADNAHTANAEGFLARAIEVFEE